MGLTIAVVFLKRVPTSYYISFLFNGSFYFFRYYGISLLNLSKYN